MAKYNEIIRLHEMLNRADIPHDFEEFFDGYHICYNQHGETVCSVIEHNYSYGSSSDRLEIMGLLTPAEAINDSVAGWLTADDVFNRIFSAHRVAESMRRTYKAVDCSINGAGGEVWEGSMPSWD
jgi:hypothetical protein